MDTRPLRIFLLGTTLAVGAVIGLAPAGEARPIIEIDPSGPVIELPPTTAPPTTVKPPKGIDPCDIRNCDEPPVLEDPCINIRGCPTTTSTTMPSTTTTRPGKPGLNPDPPRKSENPDVVVQTPRFTG